MKVHVAVISARRPGAATDLASHLPRDATWYVPPGEEAEYRLAGAARIRAAETLVEARNLALDDAFANGHLCVQTSDDLTGIKRLGVTDHQPISLGDAIDEMRSALAETGARLAGCAPTANPFYGAHKVSTAGFVVGDLIAVAPTDLRFDPALRLKEDYDYTCQHLATYGAVARCDWILATYRHRTNAGGAVSYRNRASEREAIQHLVAKWPGVFRLNPKRANEILMRWPK